MAGKLLAGVGVAALVLLGVSGLVALGVVRERVTLVAQDSSPSAARGAAPLELVAEDLTALRADVEALSRSFGPQFEELYNSLDSVAAERALAQGAALERLSAAVAALSGRVESLAAVAATREAQVQAGLEQLRVAVSERADAAVTSAPGTADVASTAEETRAELSAPPDATLDTHPAEPQPPLSVEPQLASPSDPTQSAPAEPAAPAPRKFLSFSLPSKSFSFAGRQRLAIVPSLSRVGFDAKSTLHDFSGVTQKVEGELEVDLAQPTQSPSGAVLVDARSLDTGMADRDAGLREHLDTQRHAQLRFTWTALREAEVDATQQRVRAVAVGRLSIKGVEREVAMPVIVSVDASQRVGIEGELKVRLRDFGVEPPSQLGMIKVENEIRLWIALRARSLGPVVARARDAK